MGTLGLCLSHSRSLESSSGMSLRSHVTTPGSLVLRPKNVNVFLVRYLK